MQGLCDVHSVGMTLWELCCGHIPLDDVYMDAVRLYKCNPDPARNCVTPLVAHSLAVQDVVRF